MDKFEKRGIRQSYSTGPYNKMNDTEQWVRLSQGCPNRCPFCYEPSRRVVFPVPPIERNIVKIMDMNFLSQDCPLARIQFLGNKKANKRVVYYELVCGIDHRFLTQELADAFRKARFTRLRLAWDYEYANQFEIRKALKYLWKAGYTTRNITVFMICNWRIPYEVCLQKLNLCAIWTVKVADCYFDGQVSPKIEPIGWTKEEIKDFRKRVRKHNQLVNFGIDPELRQKSS